jgi:BirA family biotin operon repressor/biotin-[acetyl-CoA-carboxylase] ligase
MENDQAPSRFKERLRPSDIRKGLGTALIGREVLLFDRIDSTNRVAMELGREGAPEGAVVIAEEQTSGRGRLGRTWLAPPCSSILMSILLRPRIPPSRAFSLTAIASVALLRAIQSTTGLKPMIKWPNDIYIQGKKAAGILTEVSADQSGLRFAVVGIGLNVNINPSAYPEIRDTATSLQAEAGKSIPRVDLVRAILEAMDGLYAALAGGEQAMIHREWKAASLVLGRPVRIVAFDAVEEGVVEEIEEDGTLLLRDSEGNLKRIVAGDVSLRL